MAQLVERYVRNVQAMGSNPIISTTSPQGTFARLCLIGKAVFFMPAAPFPKKILRLFLGALIIFGALGAYFNPQVRQAKLDQTKSSIGFFTILNKNSTFFYEFISYRRLK